MNIICDITHTPPGPFIQVVSNYLHWRLLKLIKNFQNLTRNDNTHGLQIILHICLIVLGTRGQNVSESLSIFPEQYMLICLCMYGVCTKIYLKRHQIFCHVKKQCNARTHVMPSQRLCSANIQIWTLLIQHRTLNLGFNLKKSLHC